MNQERRNPQGDNMKTALLALTLIFSTAAAQGATTMPAAKECIRVATKYGYRTIVSAKESRSNMGTIFDAKVTTDKYGGAEKANALNGTDSKGAIYSLFRYGNKAVWIYPARKTVCELRK